MATGSNAVEQTGLAADICRQIRKSANVRYLRALPVFKVEQDLPRDLIELLRDLERSERVQMRRAS
jgi:hypothetical protein